jgi:hypothetical protein
LAADTTTAHGRLMLTVLARLAEFERELIPPASANHASTRTTQLYDRRRDEMSLDEVERVVI